MNTLRVSTPGEMTQGDFMDDVNLGEWLDRLEIKERLRPTRILQGVLLEMLKVLDEVCVENGLRYYVFYGTLLGAMRHRGFIP